MQIPEISAHRKFVSAGCHAHSNAHKPPKTVAYIVLMLEYKFYLKCIVLIRTYRLTQKLVCHAHFNANNLKKIENICADISKTIKDRNLGLQI